MYPREYFDTFWRPDIKDQVFVAMSFDPAMNTVWENIFRPAIQDAGYKAIRVDVPNLSSDIVTEIMEGIAHSRIILADLTAVKGERPNPNVMYEVGLAHALRQSTEVILVRSDDNPMLFDISSIRVHKYDASVPKIARKRINELITSAQKEIDTTKNLKIKMAIDLLDNDSIQLMRDFGIGNGFTLKPLKTRDDYLVGISRTLAVQRLLELAIVRTNMDFKPGDISYLWTDFGKAVIKQMNFPENYIDQNKTNLMEAIFRRLFYWETF